MRDHLVVASVASKSTASHGNGRRIGEEIFGRVFLIGRVIE